MNQKTQEFDVTPRSVISVHTKLETSKRLQKLATATRRSKSFLANEAIERYLQEEEAFVTSVHRGIADAESGSVYTTDQARKRIKKFVVKKVAKATKVNAS